MEIREIKESDFAQVVEIIKDYKREMGNELSPEKEPAVLATLQGLIGRAESTTLTAVEGEQVKGFVNAHCCPFPLICGDEWYITELFINKECRGEGVGSALLGELEDRAKKAGVIRMCLNNFRTLESYKREFYSKHGYVVREQAANFIKIL